VNKYDKISKNGEFLMQASRVNGYITNEGHLVLDVPLSLPPGKVEIILLSPLPKGGGGCYETDALQKTETKEAEQSGSPEEVQEISYTSEQEATIKAFLAAAGCGSSGNPDSSVNVDEVLYGMIPLT
jgi:hypothetical protein